jgi:hypothetical protein
VPEAATTDPAPARACSECGAPQDERQEICVECGHAAPPPGRRQRIRRALPTISLAAFAVLLAASAAYGLSAGGASNVRDLGLAAKPPAPPTVASATPTPPPATPAPVPPATATPPPAPPAASTTPKTTTKPKPAATTPAPNLASSNPSPAATTPHHHSGIRARSKNPHHHTQSGPSWLSGADSPYAAHVYDPNGSGAGEHTSASATQRAVDGKAGTAWTTADHPGGLGKPGVGLVVEAGGFQGYSGLGIQTATPGFSVSIYSTDQSTPPETGDPAADGWRLEGRKAAVAKQQSIALKGATAQPHYLLVWITKLPPGKQRAGLSEISLLP